MHLAAKLDIQRQIFKINQWRRFCNSLKSEKKVHIIFLRMLICFSNLVFDLINNFKKSRMWWSVFNFGKIPKKNCASSFLRNFSQKNSDTYFDSTKVLSPFVGNI